MTRRSFPLSLRITLPTFTGSIFTPAAWDTIGTQLLYLEIDRGTPTKGRFTHSMPCPCCAHSPAMPCREGFRMSFPFDLHSAAVSDSHLPCSDHAVLKATEQYVRRETACGLPARVRLLPATTSYTKIVIRSIPILLTIHTYDCKEW